MTSERAVLDWQWRDLGVASWDGARVAFPRPDPVPGIYRFALWEPDGRFAVYIGETDLLPRRFGNYRSPGNKQPTNLRMNAELIGCLSRRGQVQVAVVTSAWIGDGQSVPVALDLTAKAGRVLLENAAIVSAARNGWQLHNL